MGYMKNLAAFAAIEILGCALAFGQAVDLPEGPSGAPTYANTMGTGPRQLQSLLALPTQGIPFFTRGFTSFGQSNPFNFIGSDPELGAATTLVNTAIVPLKFVFPNPGNPALDGSNVVAATVGSPIFQSADFATGGSFIGFTQYGDAIQRAEFWNLPGFSQDYHVLLAPPAISPSVVVNVPSGKGNVYLLRSGGLIGVVDPTYFDQILATLLPSFPANTVVMFLTDNVDLGTAGLIQNCCILGFHSSSGPPATTAQTWIFASYTEPGTFTGNAILDVQALSHETAEWLNDPFVGAFQLGFLNFIPPAVLPGQGGACIINFETGDPLEAPPAVFTATVNGVIYHVQDEVFLPWYLHTAPSFSVNGFYTYLGTFTSPSALCGPG